MVGANFMASLAAPEVNPDRCPATPLRHSSRGISRSRSATENKPFSQGGWRDHGGAEVMMYLVDRMVAPSSDPMPDMH